MKARFRRAFLGRGGEKSKDANLLPRLSYHVIHHMQRPHFFGERNRYYVPRFLVGDFFDFEVIFL
jgi:hypothetical protein